MDEERDDLYEDNNPSQENIEMYKAMIDADIERKRKEKINHLGGGIERKNNHTLL